LLRLRQLAIAYLEPLQRLRLALQCLRFERQGLRQPLLQVTDPSALTRGRRAGGLGPSLRLRGLCAPRHRSLLASRRATTDDRLSERAPPGQEGTAGLATWTPASPRRGA